MRKYLLIPAEPLPDVEEYLSIVGRPKPVSYAVVDVDNRAGAAEYGVYDINLYTPEGDVVTLQNVNNQGIEWGHDVPPEAVDLYYSLGDYEDVAVGQRTDDYAITDQPLPEKVSRIDVTQTGGGVTQVYPEVTGEEKTSAEMQQEWMDQQ